MSEAIGRVANLVHVARRWSANNRELVRFVAVGGAAYVVNNVVWYFFKWTVLETRPVTASVVAVVVATVFSYVLNREWSFNSRGGRPRYAEALLFFTVSGIGMIVNVAGLYISRYVLHLQEPDVSRMVQEIADFISYSILGTLAAAVFRWWAFRKWVFPVEKEPVSTLTRSPRRPVSVTTRKILTHTADRCTAEPQFGAVKPDQTSVETSASKQHELTA